MFVDYIFNKLGMLFNENFICQSAKSYKLCEENNNDKVFYSN